MDCCKLMVKSLFSNLIYVSPFFRVLVGSLLIVFWVSYDGGGRKLVGFDVSHFYESESYQELLIASARGDVERIDKLARGLDVNKVGNEGMTPLMWALMAYSYEGAEALLRNGANPNYRAEHNGASPMFIAAISPSTRGLNLLLDHGGDPNMVELNTSVLSEALNASKQENARLLLSRGADIDLRIPVTTRNALSEAFSKTRFDNVLFLLENGANYKFSFGLHEDYLIEMLKDVDGRLSKQSEQYQYYLEVIEFLREKGETI